ncbi:MAG: type IV toxin-antitoxin system AbiEi family antitoxin, partial [Cyanobacteria bacterium J06555_12]
LRDRWEVGYAETLYPKLLLGRFSPIGSQAPDEIFEELLLRAEAEGYLIGGELGAAVATEYLRPQTAVLHVNESYRMLIPRLRLKPDPKGSISFLSIFGTKNTWSQDRRLADPLLIRAELLRVNDERLRETAELLLDQCIREGSQDV